MIFTGTGRVLLTIYRHHHHHRQQQTYGVNPHPSPHIF